MTIETDSSSMGCLGTKLLLDTLDNKETNNLHVRSKVSLVVRNSAQRYPHIWNSFNHRTNIHKYKGFFATP